MPFEEKRLRKVSLLKSGWRLCRKGSLGWPNIFGGSIAAAESSSARAFLHEVMSSEPSVSTPKQKKRVPQLVAFYEEIGTPKTRKKRSNTDAAPEEPTMSPPKKQKTEEVEEEVITEPMEVVEETVAVEEEVEAVKTKEPRSSRKSRRTKELTLSKFSKRIFSATEILSTERTYVEALQQLHKAWITPLSQVLSDNDIHRIFGNIVSILKFAETLLGKIERRMKNFDPETTLIGDIFVSLVPFLSIYTDFCCNYGEGMMLLNKMKAENSEVAATLYQSYLDCNGADVQDFCITPVQRVPRYRLLLEQLLKNTPAEHPDFAPLTQAVQLVSDKAAEINKKMVLVDQQKRMMELHRRFIAAPMANEELVQPWRSLTAEFGAKWLKIVAGEIQEVDATLYLFNDIFVLARPEEVGLPGGKLVAITGQPLWNCFLKKLEPAWRLASLAVAPFQVVNPSGTWNLILDNKAKFKTDFETLRDATLAHSAEKKSKRQLIKLFANHEIQEWSAVEPAPTYASNRVSKQIMEAETTEFTKMALEELLSENRERFESRSVTPAKTPKKSRLGKLMDSITPLKWSSKKGAQPNNSSGASIPNTPAGANASQSQLNRDSNNAQTPLGLSASSGTVPIYSHGISSASLNSPVRCSSAGDVPSIDSTVANTPSRQSLSRPLDFSSPSMAHFDSKENGSADSYNQADVLRSTIAKLSQTSALQKSGSGPSFPSVKKNSITDSPASTMSVSASSIASPMEAKRRRHRKASTATDNPLTAQ